MKRYVLSLLMVLASVVSAWADNQIILSSPSGIPGGEVTVSVALHNTDKVAALQFAIPLGQYLTYVKESAVLESARSNGHTISASASGGVLKLVVYSANNAALNGDSGNLLSFKLKLGRSGMAVSLTPEVELSGVDGNSISCGLSVGTVTILSPMMKIDRAQLDYGYVPMRESYQKTVAISNPGTADLHIQLSLTDSTFALDQSSFAIAPAERKEVVVTYHPVTRGKVSAELIVASDASNEKTQKIDLLADPYSVNELFLSDIMAAAGEEVEMSLSMNNMEPIVGVDCQLQLPDALEYVEGSFKSAQRSSKLNSASKVKDGVLSLMLYSANNAPIEEGEGEIGTFRVRIAGRNGKYTVAEKMVELINANQENMVSGMHNAEVYIESPIISSIAKLPLGDIPIGQDYPFTCYVYNSGETSLVISQISFDDDACSLDMNLPIVIERYSELEIPVRLHPTKLGEHSNTMKIYSNDPERPVTKVPISYHIYEHNGLTLSGTPIHELQDYQISVALDNYNPISALQFDVQWKEGVSLSTSDVSLTSRTSGMTVSVAQMEKDKWKVLLYSLSNQSIASGKEEICRLNFKGNGQSLFESLVSLDNIELSSEDGKNKNSLETVTYQVKTPVFAVKYIIDGEIYKSVDYKYGGKTKTEVNPIKEGHTFSGWSEIPTVMPGHDVEVFGSFEVNKYLLTYQVDDEDYKTDSVAFGTVIKLIEEPVKEGSHFSGWKGAPATMPSRDIIITGSFKTNIYALTYKVNGEAYKVRMCAFGDKIPAEAEPTKEGYTFSGWSEIPAVMPNHDVEVTGSFAANKYLLTYQIDGEEFQKDTIVYGAAIHLLEGPMREGCTFSGWSEAPTTMPAQDVVITGSFKADIYTVTYIVDGEVHNTVHYAFGTSITPETAPQRKGYTFSGWSEIPATMPAHDVEITGSLSINKYLLTYLIDGVEYQKDSVVYGSAITLIEEPVREGSSFSGWSGAPATMPTRDVVITGCFYVNTYTLTYKLDGKDYNTIHHAFGDSIKSPAVIQRTGYTFSGWSEIPTTMPSHDVEVIGSLTVNKYLLTYQINGEDYQKDSVAYGTTITAIDGPTKEGYAFSGWKGTPTSMPARDVVVTGTLKVNVFTLTYKVDNVFYASAQYTVGDTIVLLDYPTKEGFTFTGWKGAPTTMSARDIEVNGYFEYNLYTLTFQVDGETVASEQYMFGDTITLIDEPAMEGKTFSGWKGVSTTMPSHDVIVVGSFDSNIYALTYKVDGEVYKTVQNSFGAAIVPEAEPTKVGYTFSGWSDIPVTMPAEDVSVSGSFKANLHYISYLLEDKEYAKDSCSYGEKIPFLYKEEADLYMFSSDKGSLEVDSTLENVDIVYGQTSWRFSGDSYKVNGLAFSGSSFPKQNPQVLQYAEDGSIMTVDPSLTQAANYGAYIVLRPKTSGRMTFYIKSLQCDNQVFCLGEQDGSKNPTDLYFVFGPGKGTFYSFENGTAPQNWKNGWTYGSRHTGIRFTVEAGVEYYLFVKGSKMSFLGLSFETVATPEKFAHSFDGWQGYPTDMVMKDQDLTITGSFTANLYNLSYGIDGWFYDFMRYEYGDSITPLEEPSKEGYTFSGWESIPVTMPEENIIAMGYFWVNAYSLTYKVDGEVYKIDTVNYNTAITPEANPSKEGYTFLGWSVIPDTMPAHDIEINGSFSVNKYLLTYELNGETYLQDSVPYGANITSIDVQPEEGYTFSGWSEVPAAMPAQDVVIKGSVAVNKYILSYKVDGNVYKVDTIDYGSAIVPEENPTKVGYTFSGWSDIPVFMPMHDVEVNGSFAVNNYLLTYKLDGVIYYQDSVMYGASITLIGTLSKDGYTFSGWSKSPATMPAEDLVISGSFTINTYTLLYKVDGALYKSLSVNFGSVITAETEPAKPGYTFSGWRGIPNIMPSHDVTAVGSFVLNTRYRLTYTLDGNEYKSDSIPYGAEITPEAEPSKAGGYVFSGWSEIPTIMPEHDVTVIGSFGFILDVCDTNTGKSWTKLVADGKELTSDVLSQTENDVFFPTTFDMNYFSSSSKCVTFEGDGIVESATSVRITGAQLKVLYAGGFLKDEIFNMKINSIGAYLVTVSALDAKGNKVSVPLDKTTAGNACQCQFKMSSDAVSLLVELTVPDGYLSITKVQNDKVYFESYGDFSSIGAYGSSDGENWYLANPMYRDNYVDIPHPYTYYKLKGTLSDGTVVWSDVYSASSTKSYPTFVGLSSSRPFHFGCTMPAHNVKVNGVSALKWHLLTYLLDGVVYRQDSVAYGTAIVPEPNPIKDGYIFSGWSEIPTSMPAEDVVINGSWTIDGLEQISTERKDAVAVDLLGRKVQNLRSGQIYIQNGKKMIAK